MELDASPVRRSTPGGASLFGMNTCSSPSRVGSAGRRQLQSPCAHTHRHTGPILTRRERGGRYPRTRPEPARREPLPAQALRRAAGTTASARRRPPARVERRDRSRTSKGIRRIRAGGGARTRLRSYLSAGVGLGPAPRASSAAALRGRRPGARTGTANRTEAEWPSDRTTDSRSGRRTWRSRRSGKRRRRRRGRERRPRRTRVHPGAPRSARLKDPPDRSSSRRGRGSAGADSAAGPLRPQHPPAGGRRIGRRRPRRGTWPPGVVRAGPTPPTLSC